MSTWEERMAERSRKLGKDFGPMPTEYPAYAPACCYEWRLDGSNGWLLFLTCGHCEHEHHKDELWMAAGATPLTTS